MKTQRNEAEKLEEEISNAGAYPHGDQVPLIEEGMNDDQDPVNPPPLTDGDIRSSLFQLAPAVTAQAQAMKAQANQEVVPSQNE